MALKLKMFDVQFVFVVCSMLTFASFNVGRSALSATYNVFDNFILYNNTFLQLMRRYSERSADKKSSQSCVILFIFPSIFQPEKIQVVEMKFGTNFPHFDFLQLIRREK